MNAKPIFMLLLASLLAGGMFSAVLAGTNERFHEEVFVENEPVYIDAITRLEWKSRQATGKTWAEALAYCEGLQYAGKDDWRLPNKPELLGIVNYDRDSPATDFPLSPAERFWTSTTATGDPQRAWYVNFTDGGVRYELKGNRYYVRCVRDSGGRE